jgi:hypothetical protein
MLKEKYSPMYFLSSLGAGGLAISFFMYLTFLVPHKGYPMATFEHIYMALMEFNLLSLIAGISLLFMILLTFYHFKLLIWNIKEYLEFKKTNAFETLKKTNAEATLMAIPLTFTMSINVSFAVGAVFVPNLWSVVEYLFPIALIAMITAGFFALKIFGAYTLRVFTQGGFNFKVNNNFSQLIAIFAFSMLAVSFAAPGAMSHYMAINAIGIALSIFFISLSVILLVPKLLFGINEMLARGIDTELSPSLWIMVPILTLLGIAIVRIDMGIMHNFESEIPKISLALTQTSFFIFTTIILSLQIIFGAVGYGIMKKLNYFEKYVYSNKKSVISFALICPGVAAMVFGMFFINFGLVFTNIIDKYSIIYYILMVPFIYIQYKTFVLFMQLKKKFAL